MTVIVIYTTTMLTQKFFNKPADEVARALIGCLLCVQTQGEVVRLPITETEAYMGPHDLACHASKGRTVRTETMFMGPGTIYVYLIYGMYDMLNIVTGEEGYPAAVLIRGAGVHDGPGKLTKALGITRTFNAMKLGRNTGVWIEQGDEVPAQHILNTPRIGVAYAGAWAHKKLRFVLKAS